jgi:hypothetical protein
MNLDKYKKGWAYHRAKRRISEVRNKPEQITMFDISELER